MLIRHHHMYRSRFHFPTHEFSGQGTRVSACSHGSLPYNRTVRRDARPHFHFHRRYHLGLYRLVILDRLILLENS